MDGEGSSSERCLKWGDAESLRYLSKNTLKQGVSKGESCSASLRVSKLFLRVSK